MTEQSAGRLRRRAEAASFNLAWDAALLIGGDRLRSIAWERAVAGTVKRHYYRGRVVGEDRVYDMGPVTDVNIPTSVIQALF